MYIAKIFDDSYPANCWFGSLIGAPDYESALSVFKIRFPNWESLTFQITDMP
jgi:hypothetical protein